RVIEMLDDSHTGDEIVLPGQEGIALEILEPIQVNSPIFASIEPFLCISDRAGLVDTHIPFNHRCDELIQLDRRAATDIHDFLGPESANKRASPVILVPL